MGLETCWIFVCLTIVGTVFHFVAAHEEICDAVDDAPDLVYGPPVQGYRLVGSPVLFVRAQNEALCQYACKVQRFVTGCDAYNFKDQTDTEVHDCEMFNASSVVRRERQNGTHFRIVEEVCHASDCLCNATSCGYDTEICFSEGPGQTFNCSSCLSPWDWLQRPNSTTMAEYCKTFGWYQLGKSIFKPVREAKTWGEARNYCQSLGADLPSISSKTDMDFLEDYLAANKEIQYVMANGGENCKDACSRNNRECSETGHNFPKDGKGVLDIFKSLGISCIPGKAKYTHADNPGYFTKGIHAGKCVGYESIPDVINCMPGSNLALRRLCPCLKVPKLKIMGHWKFDGTDPDVKLNGNARYETVDGRKSLYLNGQSGTFAEVPAFDFPPDVTIACWIRVHDPPSLKNHIFADWRNPHRFSFGLTTNTADNFLFQLRNAAMIDVALTNTIAVGVPKETWFHVTMSWQLSTKTLKVYVNSSLIGTEVSTFSGDTTYMTNNHNKFDIGRTGDDPNNPFNGHLQDLAVFRRVLTLEEISGIYHGNFVQKGVWTGLNDLHSEGTFRWSDGSAVNYKSWRAGQPNAPHKLEDCVLLKSSKWNDVSCGLQLGFACEKACDNPLGAALGGRLPDSSFTASSSYDGRYPASKGRLNGQSHGWAPGSKNFPNEHLQVDLGELYWVFAVATQGCKQHSNEWITKFMIGLSINNIGWNIYQQDDGDKVFLGNTDADTVVTNRLTVPAKARFVRFIVMGYAIYPVLRVELFGWSTLPY